MTNRRRGGESEAWKKKGVDFWPNHLSLCHEHPCGLIREIFSVLGCWLFLFDCQNCAFLPSLLYAKRPHAPSSSVSLRRRYRQINLSVVVAAHLKGEELLLLPLPLRLNRQLGQQFLHLNPPLLMLLVVASLSLFADQRKEKLHAILERPTVFFTVN